MWKAVAVVAVIYGLMALIAVFAPDTVLLNQPLNFSRVFAGDGSASHVSTFYDFTYGTPHPEPHLLPQSQVELVPLGGNGGSALHWTVPPAPVSAVGFPVDSSAVHPEMLLTLRLAASAPVTAAVGVHEADGSIYAHSFEAIPKMREYSIPLSNLRSAFRTEDENGQLDAQQIDGILLAVVTGGPGRQGRRSADRLERIPGQDLTIGIDYFGLVTGTGPDS